MDARRGILPCSIMSHRAGVLGEMVAQWCWGGVREVVCTLNHTAGCIWGEPGRKRCPQDGGETAVPSGPDAVQPPAPPPLPPPPPLSPLQGSALQPALDPGKIDCLFLPDCSRVTGCRDEGRRGAGGAGGLLLIRMDFSASLLVGRAGTGYGRLLKE